MQSKRILLLSAYDAISHRHWRKGLVAAFPEYAWTVLTLPPRHFSWRIRGNSLSWAFSERSTLESDFDLIIATSMTDLSALKGLLPSLAGTPSLLYFHENQFDYPVSGNEFRSIEAKITSLYAALAATRIAFNSDYNRQTFLHGVQSLLKKLPDHVPAGLPGILQSKSSCLPVPLDSSWTDLLSERDSPKKDCRFTILWNHRWEYDKAPERLFLALLRLKEKGVNFRVHIIGQRFRRTPSVFKKFKEALPGHIGAWGYIEDHNKYQQTVRQSHVVVSTSLHDFQGLSILEATAAGCIPLVPDRLAYREFIPASFRYESWPDEENRESEALAAALFHLADMHANSKLPVPPDISRLSWPNMRQAYKTEINMLLQSHTLSYPN